MGVVNLPEPVNINGNWNGVEMLNGGFRAIEAITHYRAVQELLHQRGIEVSHETLREWCIKFGSLFAEALRHRELRRRDPRNLELS